MSKKIQCPVCVHIDRNAPALLPIEVSDPEGGKKPLFLCPKCLAVWPPEEIPSASKKKRGKERE